MSGFAPVKLALSPHFNLVDGTHSWFQVDANTARGIFESLRDERPDISLGYSRELWKRYRKDPASLVSSPVRSDDVYTKRISYTHRPAG